MIYRLIVLNGPTKGQRVTVDPEPMTIGRDEGCAVHLPDNEMALRHAELVHRGSELFIHDLGSMNKIILNKHEVQDSRLKHGDIIELGRTRLLVQAIVQAEVQNAPEETPARVRRGKKRKLAIAASVLLLAGGTWAIIQSGYEVEEPAGPAVLPGLTDFPETEPVEPLEAPAPVVVETAVSAPEPAPSPAAPPLDDEVRKIREDLSMIQQHLQQLNAGTQLMAEEVSVEPEEIAVIAGPPAPVDDVEAVMKAARDAMAASEYEQADIMLEHLEIEHPDYLPAYRARAELYELRGMTAKARDQWTAILQRTTESELYRKAVSERIRLGRAESQQLISAHEAVRIKAVDQVRFRESADYDEMRTIKIHLLYDRSLGPIDPKGVRLLVYFFEQDLDTLRVNLSKVQPYVEANLSALQQDAGESFLFTVNYVAPKGYYSRDHNTSRQRYFGFIARLHYFDQLVDEQARPPKLLEPAILEAAGLALQTAGRDEAKAMMLPSTN